MHLSQALIFDLNGTMINDMPFHLDTWHDILNNELGARLTREEVKQQMYGKNQELLVRVFGKNRFTLPQMDRISMQKEIRYQEIYRPHLKLIDGLPDLLDAAQKANIPMAIGSAAIRFNIDFVLDTLAIRHYFRSIISADDVQKSKPDPETFLMAAEELGIPARECIVLEDAPKGVEAAANAGMAAVVLTTLHAEKEFAAYNNILVFAENYRHPFFTTCLHAAPVN